MDPFVGQIFSFGCNFAPVGYLACAGQTLPISQYEVLFTLIGTTFGGDGVNNFMLPDLRSRAPIHYGQGPGLSNYDMGQKGGNTSFTLTANQMPSHTHGSSTMAIQVNNAAAGGTTPNPVNDYLAVAPAALGNFYSSAKGGPYPNVSFDPLSISGGSQPMDITNPYQALNYCIAVEGLYPSHP